MIWGLIVIGLVSGIVGLLVLLGRVLREEGRPAIRVTASAVRQARHEQPRSPFRKTG